MSPTLRESRFSPLTLFCLFTVILLTFAWLGIATRPNEYLASFWPANSILLGLLARYPKTRSIYSLLGAFCGYVLADLSNGSDVLLSCVLTTANMIYVVTTLALYQYFREFIHSLHRGYFYLFVFTFCTLGGLLGASFAALAVPYVTTAFMNGPFLLEVGDWFTAELQNALLLLPIMLNIPRWKKKKFILAPIAHGHNRVVHSLPLLALIFSLFMSYIDSGPGSLLYSIAALIWCALTYRHFFVTLITSFTCGCIIFWFTQEYLVVYPHLYTQNSISLRLGIIMMAIAPLTVSSINEVRSRLIRQLQYNLAYDDLTICLSRRQFMESAGSLLEQMQNKQRYAAVLMLDIDHFKKINDSYGHQAGDRALQICAETIQENLRSYDLLGRLGGEEFAALLIDIHPQHALQIAERIRHNLSKKQVEIAPGTVIQIQTSIGLHICEPQQTDSIEVCLKEADDALYQAKRSGRNQVITTI